MLHRDVGTKGGRPEIASLTSLRGLLACWVVAFHFWNDVLTLFPDLDFASPFVRKGWVAVPAFFMLSGFVLTLNYYGRFARLGRASYRGFLRQRLGRIYPVHVVALSVVLVLKAADGALGLRPTDENTTLRDFILNLLLVHAWVPDFRMSWNYPSWSISSEWFAYLLFPPTAVLLHRIRRTLAFDLGLATAAVIGSVLILHTGKQRPFFELLQVVPTFAAGMSIFFLVDRIPREDRRIRRACRIAVPLLAAAIVAACFLLNESDRHLIPIVPCFFLTIAALAQLNCDGPRWLNLRPVAALGEVSYSLYMTHAIAQMILYGLLPVEPYAASSLAVKLAIGTAYVAAIAILCLGSYVLVEKPSRRYFRMRPGKTAS